MFETPCRRADPEPCLGDLGGAGVAMTQDRLWRQRLLLLMAWLKRFRYVKFGLVGASGTVVNLVGLYGAHEYLFRAIEAARNKYSCAPYSTTRLTTVPLAPTKPNLT